MAKRRATTDNSAAIAAKFGVSLKALRLYEQLGMLKPPRTAAGWRVYGQPEIERLHAILSLKQLGLPLARIAELFKAGTTNLSALLAVQEEMLKEARRDAEHALALVQIARVRTRKKGALSADELSELVQSMSRSVLRMTPELEEIAQRVYTPEQWAAHAANARDTEAMSRHATEWGAIHADIEGMLPDGDPLSKKGLAIGRRMIALINEQTGGDRALWNNAYAFWNEAIHNPRTAEQVPMGRAGWEFAAKAFAELKRRGELNLTPPKTKRGTS